ncbi:MAG TPA: IS200/IS605 family transposase [Candidatus Absconditabacterales bacterium]|nr:IS200/IS605 family transposase [Candidatus Absconditabacterales bacterium]
MAYRKASHAVYDCRYHIVWITKYRRKCLAKPLQIEIQKILEGVCKELYITPIAIGMENDHVHVYLSIPLVHPIPHVVQLLKGRSSHQVFREERFKTHLKQFYWGEKKSLWAVGYFCATVGAVDQEIIKAYVEQQGQEDIQGEEIEL